MTEPLNMAIQTRVTDKGLKPGVGSWEAWRDIFLAPRAGRRKEDAPCFVPAIFRDYAERKDANVVAMTALVLDLDDMNEGQYHDVQDHMLSYGYTFLAYSTSSDAPGSRCWRYVVPFAEPIGVSPRLWATGVWADLVGQLGLSDFVDKRCCNASRAYFLPVGTYDLQECQGKLWQPETEGVVLTEVTRAVESAVSRAANGPVVAAARTALGVLGQAVEGSGGDHLTFRAACIVARDYALTDEQALELLKEWNLSNKPPWAVWQLEHKISNARVYGKGDGSQRAQVEMLESL